MVRLMTAGFKALGISCFSRITGVVPMEISPSGVRQIVRSREGHIEELRWWLYHVPEYSEAIVVENSAVSAELQPLAAKWLKPNLVIWTNLREDHPEAWGPTKEGAMRALLSGIPKGVPVALGPDMHLEEKLLGLLKQNRNEVFLTGDAVDFEEANRALAINALKTYGLNVTEESLSSNLTDDPGRFRVLKMGNGLLAWGFSANDVESTVSLLFSLKWQKEETTVLFNNRRDRPGRLKAFEPWFNNARYKGIYICGSHPLRHIKGAKWIYFRDVDEIVSFVSERGLVFGCGNIAGLPLRELLLYEEVNYICDRI